jgi:hypothetical protein
VAVQHLGCYVCIEHAVAQLLHPRVPPPERLAKDGIFPLASGLPASPGAATGIIVFDADDADTGTAHAVHRGAHVATAASAATTAVWSSLPVVVL